MCSPVSADADASAWVAIASDDNRADAPHHVVGKVTNVGGGVRAAGGVMFSTCPDAGDLAYQLHLDVMLDVATWDHHEVDKAWFASAGLALEGDVAFTATTSIGVHLGITDGAAVLPYESGAPWIAYELGARVGLGPVKLGLDAFTESGDPFGARGVIVRATPRGTPVGWVQVAIVAVALGLLVPALEEAPVY
jgi:hypothetical protein